MTALIVLAAIAVLVLLFLTAAVKVAREYERGVIFRLGRLKSPPKGPGLFLLIPIIDKMVRVDLRTVTLNVPPQEVITKDNVPVRVNAVAYFRIIAVRLVRSRRPLPVFGVLTTCGFLLASLDEGFLAFAFCSCRSSVSGHAASSAYTSEHPSRQC